MSYQKRKYFIKNFTKTATRKLVPDLFEFAKNYAESLLENETFEARHVLDMYYQNYQNLPKSAQRPPEIPFYRGFFEN